LGKIYNKRDHVNEGSVHYLHVCCRDGTVKDSFLTEWQLMMAQNFAFFFVVTMPMGMNSKLLGNIQSIVIMIVQSLHNNRCGIND
jgi:hypothetical protein